MNSSASGTVRVSGQGPAGYDAGKKIRGRKRHIAVDAQGTPIAMTVHEASVQDRDGAPEVIEELMSKAPRVGKLWADGGSQIAVPTCWHGVLRCLGDCRKAKGYQGVRGHFPVLGCGADPMPISAWDPLDVGATAGRLLYY